MLPSNYEPEGQVFREGLAGEHSHGRESRVAEIPAGGIRTGPPGRRAYNVAGPEGRSVRFFFHQLL
jgi:hypothetical protein